MIIGKQVFLAVCTLFLFTAFILTIVATAGSSSNYSPINKVYLGEADLSHINVTKVVPATAPILTVLAQIMGAPNASYPKIFNALKSASQTAALKPLLGLLADSSNVTSTVGALTVLAPLAAQGNSAQLQEVGELIENSNNVSATLGGLGMLLETANSTDASSEALVFELLEDSNNATETVQSLYTLNNMSLAEKAQLAPVFAIFNDSSNATATLYALGTLMTTNISSSMASSLMSLLENSASPASALEQLAGSLPASMNASVTALETLLSSSNNVNGTITVLGELLEQNVTTSPSAQAAFGALTVMLMEANNKTLVIDSVATLATSSGSSTTAQLGGLESLLSASENTTETLSILEEVQSSNSSSTGSTAITALYSLIGNSTNSTGTLMSLLELTSAVQANSTAFIPLLQVLGTASYNSSAVSPEALYEITPIIMDNLNVHSLYRLSIFTLCRGLSNGSSWSCNSPHAVQSFYMRDILYDELDNSDFRPYMQALNIGKDDLYLEGKLQSKEKDYVPAVRAVLAFNLLAIILSFFTVVLALYFMFKHTADGKPNFCAMWTARTFAFLTALFLLLSGAIVAAFVRIIKTDTKDDDYNVTFAMGSAFSGLVWAAFALAFISFILLLMVRCRNRKGEVVGEKNDIGPSSSDEAEGSEKDHHQANVVSTNDTA